MSFLRSALNNLEELSKDLEDGLTVRRSFFGKDLMNRGVVELAESFIGQGLAEARKAIAEEEKGSFEAAIECYRNSISKLESYLEYESRYTNRYYVRVKVAEYRRRVVQLTNRVVLGANASVKDASAEEKDTTVASSSAKPVSWPRDQKIGEDQVEADHGEELKSLNTNSRA